MIDPAYPRVSVVIAAYKDLRFLDAAVASVTNQTFHDLELVLVDDCTAQGDIFARQAARDPRIRVLTNEANLGAMEAANRGIRVARGDIIARLDADDIARPERIARLVASLDADPELAIVGTNFLNIDENGRHGTINRMPETDIDIRWTLLFRNPFCHSTVAFRLRCFDAAGGYNPAWKASGDHEFWYRLLAHGRAANIQEILLDYRVNPRGVSATHASNWRQRTDPLRQQSWSRLDVIYDPRIAYELSRFILGDDIPDVSLRAPAYGVCLRLLRRFISAPRPFVRASDHVQERRLVRTTVEKMLADETVDVSRAVDREDLAWSRSFIAAASP
jgi:glycosyltransferase involved in cell wall biosynthesis